MFARKKNDSIIRSSLKFLHFKMFTFKLFFIERLVVVAEHHKVSLLHVLKENKFRYDFALSWIILNFFYG